MKPYSLKARILVPISLALAVLLAAFVVSFYRFQQNHVNDMVVSKLESVQELFAAKLESDAGMMGTALDAILVDERLKAALKAKDRIALLDQSLTLFGQWNAEHEITHWYFTGPDRVNILRVHKPEKHGDRIDRFTTLEAEKTGRVSYGIELGPLGTFTLRVVQPWYDGQQLIGYVELGEEIDHITRKLRNVLGVEIYVVIEKEYLDRAGWESGMRMLGRDANWNRFPSVVMIDHTQEELPEGLTEFLAEEEHTSMKTDVDVSFKNRRYRTRFIHLNDASGRGVGDMVVMTDVTDLVTHLHTAVFTIAAICVGVGGFLFALLLLFLGRVERQMTIASKELIRVTKAVESTSDATVIIDLSGQSIYQNQAFLELFGYTVEELNEAGGVSILYDDSEVFREVFEVIRRGDSWRGEVEMQTRDGRNVSISLRGDAVKEKTGEILSYVGIHTDITERKRAQEAIRESEDRFRTLFNSATDAVFIHDFEGQMQEVNRVACDRLGYSRDELLQMTPKDFNAPEEASRIPKRFKELQNKGYIRFETTHVNRNGKLIPVEIISRTISYKGKGMAISAARDISERKQAEEALRKVSEEQAILLDNIDTQIWYLTDVENHGAVNRALAEFLGVQKSDIAYKNVYDILSKEEAEVCIAGNREVFESKRQVCTEEWVKNGRGELRLLSVSKTPKLDKDGNVEYVVCAAEDITERKQADEALQDSEEKWRSLTENSIDYIMTLDCDGTLLFVNRTPSGVTREEVIGTSIFDHFPEKFKLVLKESINRVVETGEPDKHYVEYTSSDGITRHFEGRAAPIIRSGRVAAITINATDITEHQQLAEELKEHRDHLQELVEERTAELTITNEQLQQEIIERKRAERRLLTYHKRLRSLASALSLAEEKERRRIATEVHDLVGQNLALAKLKLATLLETSSSSARGAADEVNRLIDEVIQDTRFLVSELGSPVLYELGFVPAVEWLTQQTQQRHGIAIEFEADVQPKPLSEDVRILLFQAARELLANIVRHARADTAKVSITRTGDQIQVDVSDDGVGFDPAEIGPGMDETGRFGLFSIRERLEPLGGHMEVKSKPGHGTHVTLVGPLGSE